MAPEYSRQDVEAWLLTLTSGTISLLVDNMTLARDALGYLGLTGESAPKAGATTPPSNERKA